MTPSVSVVIVPGNQRERATTLLASVLAQQGIERAEIILLDAADGVAAAPRSDHAPVRLFTPARAGSLRRAARRRQSATPRTDCRLHRGARRRCRAGSWRSSVRSPPATTPAQAREVHVLNPGVGISDLVAAMNYVRWQPPARRREDVDVIVGHNAAYRRDDLLAFGDEIDRLLGSEVVLQRALVARGRPLLVDPAIRISHRNETEVRSICRGYYLWNVTFGDTWARPRAGRPGDARRRWSACPGG